MATQETTEASPHDAALPNIWLPGLIERYASFLHPNEVICTLRRVDKATAEQFRGRPDLATVRLSQPVPSQAFAARWAGSMRDLTLVQRKQLLRLTVSSGVVANLNVALEVVGFIPDLGQLTVLLKTAAAAGHVSAFHCLVGVVHKLAPGHVPDIGPLLRAAVEAGHRAVCEALMSGDACRSLWKIEHVCAALRGGHPELAGWLLQRRPEGPIGPGDSMAPLGDEACGALLLAAVRGCDLATLRALHQRCKSVYLSVGRVASVIDVAAGSRTSDWQGKVEWAESQLGPRFSAGPSACAAAARCPDAELRLTWLLVRGYPANESAIDNALIAGNVAALELLFRRGLEPGRQAIEEAIRRGRLEALRKLREHGCELDAAEVASASAGSGHLPVLMWAVEELGASLQHTWLLPVATFSRDLEALQWLRQRGCPLDAAIVASAAARRGHLPILTWAVEELGAHVASPRLLDAAAASGRVEVMAWLRQRGCPWGGDPFRNAGAAGCEAAMEWLAEQGCPTPGDGGPYTAAARNNDLATLRCLARLGCPWGPASGPLAVFESGLHLCLSLPVLRLLVELGCPVDWESSRVACHMAVGGSSEDVRSWLAAEAARRQQQQLGSEGIRKRPRTG
ncbi:hypothetical protein GPECTOR_32g475 [Gonium pectorale]|uniref:Ankyrin repeat domain-containing protein n=1 Tax=Gonium pectorale TaxID=33097 RepID=A0A150GDE9_GONPE|nr:hypothetical protein GPECTOR_32g475 [Gonium pectorale]|eukprot:KXZ47862.1 hypothetical protein GPECTOR_32g475 [Gonium pectorale]